MLPEGWKEIFLGNILDFKNGLNADKAAYGHGCKFVNVMDVINNTIIKHENIIGKVNTTAKNIDLFKLKYGDILFNRTSETKEEIALSSVYMDHSLAVYGGFVIRGRPKNSNINTDFSLYFFQSPSFRNQAIKSAQGVVRANIGQDSLSRILLPLPPLPEQKKIAAILSTWDRAIEGTEKLLANSQQQKKALMQQLLTGKKRLPGFTGEWKKTNIGNIAKEISIRNKNRKNYPVISCTKTKGFVDSLSFFNKKVYSDDLSGYKIISRNQIGFPSNHVEEGSIGLQNLHDDAIVSPIYTVFSMEENADPLFVFAVLKTDHYRQIFAAATNSSVDRRGSLRWSAFSQIKINLPSLPEQQAIAAVLTTADEEITTIESDLSRLRQEKKALMQQLLTGKRRVKVD